MTVLKSILWGSCLVSTLFAAPVETPLPVWQYPARWSRHNQLRQVLVEAVKRGDLATWEKAARAGIEAIPGDGTWHYNLACCLSLKGAEGLALTELEKAVKFGFRDVDSIEKDSDLMRIRQMPRYAEIVAKARQLRDFPVAGRPVPTMGVTTVGGTLTLTATNVVWDFDLGVYHALCQLTQPSGGLAVSPHARAYKGPASEFVMAWLSEGTAAGNAGDIYVNRDAGHSVLATGDFPFLTRLNWGQDARDAHVDCDLPLVLFPTQFGILGNASRARTGDCFWRSLARQVLTDSDAARRLNLMYLSNQLWFFPAHKDIGPDVGDAFSAVAPFQVVSVGSSFTDQPLMRACAAASASFLPPVKQTLLARHLYAPTLQWLLRRSLKGVSTEQDYLSAKAHPTAFTKTMLDEAAMVERAHRLRPTQIPPVAALSLINSRLYPIPMPVPGRDYPDIASEITFLTPTAIGIVLRGPQANRTFLVRAQGFPPPEASKEKNDQDLPTVEFCWKVVHGDPARVTIEAPLGETENGPDKGFAQIKINRKDLTNRIDVACFARSGTSSWGVPSFISFAPIPYEKRTYADDGRYLEIDYNAYPTVYCDPLIALSRAWKDVYEWANDGRILGFKRWANGKMVGVFTPQGERILARDSDGKPIKTVAVRYFPRAQKPGLPPELTWSDVQ